MRDEKELTEFLTHLIKNRKTYLKQHRNSAYSRKIYHYIKAIKFVINPEEIGIDELGLFKFFRYEK